MKNHFLTLLACMTILPFTISAQNEWELGVNYVLWVADEDGKVYKDQDVGAVVAYKDIDGNILYREAHTGTTNTLGNLNIKVGDGFPIKGTLDLDVFKDVWSFCYDITTTVDGTERMISGEVPVCSAPRANAAGCARSAEFATHALFLGGIFWGGIIVNINQFIVPLPGYNYYMTAMCDDGDPETDKQFVSIPLTELVRARTAPKVNASGPEINYLNIGTGLGWPMYCGPEPEFINAMHAIRMATISNLLYGVDISIDNYSADHSTWAILGRNGNSMGGGILGFGPGNIGVFGVGRGGMQAQGSGTGNTYGVYGLNTTAAQTGESKAGIIAYNGGHPSNYAIQISGKWSYTEAGTMVSDLRWKREIKSTTGNALAAINQLRPSTYYFVEDTPYGLPKGLQHGFIAQELETVFPELVAEIVFPTTYDPELILNSGTATFKGIQYDGLIPILTAGIQELDTKVTQQQDEIRLLKKTVTELTSRLEALER